MSKWGKKIGTVAGVAAYLYLQNTWIQKTEYHLSIPQLGAENEGLKIAHLSDLHLPQTKIDLTKLITMLQKEEPDLIFLTGDQVDAADPFNLEEAIHLFKQLRAIAPTYAVNGNHDITSPNRSDLVKLYRESGVVYLQNEAYSVMLDGRKPLVIMGVAEQHRLLQPVTLKPLSKIPVREDWQGQTRLLLAHHPEHFEKYHQDPRQSPDVTFSGHAHGGQIRIPKIGGLFAPGQGKMPKHTSGVFGLAQNPLKKLVVSRGLGPSQFPFRINNRPELVIVTLGKE